jgi:hypothetical protein
MRTGVNNTYESLRDTLTSEVREDIDVMEVCTQVGEQSDRWLRYRMIL